MKHLIIVGSAVLFMGCSKDNPQPTSFTMYSAMQYENMPALNTIGFQQLNLINETSLFTSSTDESPDTSKVAALAVQAAAMTGVPACLDIEAWSYSNSALASTIDSFMTVIDVFKEHDPNGLGFYGVVPNDAYNWTNIGPLGSTNYLNWQQLNIALTPIAQQVAMFFPSFYTFDDDTDSWKDFVSATLSELHKYNVNKPVYAFLWPQYHDGTPDQYQFIDTAVWRCELETLYPQVNGIVLWSSSKVLPGVSNVWDPTWPWWITTQAFMAEHHIQ